MQFNNHIGVFCPDIDVKQARALIDKLGHEAKAYLGVEGFSILRPMDMEDYNEELDRAC